MPITIPLVAADGAKATITIPSPVIVSGHSITALHYAAGGTPADGAGAVGFNLADVSNLHDLNALPAGTKGLVWVDQLGGATTAFKNFVSSFSGNPKLYGFYLFDEPDITGTWGTYVSPADIKAQSDYVHATCPGAIATIVLVNQGSEENPTYFGTDKTTKVKMAYTPANTGLDLFAIDPYPCRTDLPGGYDISIIGKYTAAAIASGVPAAKLVPVYQTFGGWPPWTVPSATQLEAILKAWGSLLPHPAFDYAYAWGQQQSDTPLSQLPALQAVMRRHNALIA